LRDQERKGFQNCTGSNREEEKNLRRFSGEDKLKSDQTKKRKKTKEIESKSIIGAGAPERTRTSSDKLRVSKTSPPLSDG